MPAPAPLRQELTVLAVADVSVSAAFYRAVLGWTQVVDEPVFAQFDGPGGARVGLYQRDGFAGTAGAPVTAPPTAGAVTGAELYLHVDDGAALDDAIARITSAGGRPLSPRAPRMWGDETAYFADPDGHVVAIGRSLG